MVIHIFLRNTYTIFYITDVQYLTTYPQHALWLLTKVIHVVLYHNVTYSQVLQDTPEQAHHQQLPDLTLLFLLQFRVLLLAKELLLLTIPLFLTTTSLLEMEQVDFLSYV